MWGHARVPEETCEPTIRMVGEVFARVVAVFPLVDAPGMGCGVRGEG